jgi:hypothetical protein
VRERHGYPLDFPPPPVADQRFHTALQKFRVHRHREWLYDLRGPTYIEPARGFVFGPRCEWLADPFNYHHLLEETPWRSALSAIIRRRRIRTLDCAVSLRSFPESNYWHFYDDLLSKLRLVDELDLPADVPLLVGENLWREPFFVEATSRGSLRTRNWVLHSDIFRVERLILPVPMSLQRVNSEYVLQALEAPPSTPSDRRLFVNRAARRRRSLVNLPELLPILDECGFEVIDTDGMPVADQIALFARARLVVANHGAGLANLIFRVGQPLDLVELFAPDYIQPHFVWLAATFGFGYDALVGEPAGEGNFRVDAGELRGAIARAVKRIEGAAAAYGHEYSVAS